LQTREIYAKDASLAYGDCIVSSRAAAIATLYYG